jgi:Skp family chaperone for outer membrane proteins
MNVRSLLVAGLAAGALLPLAPAMAQTPTAPAQAPIVQGAPITGYCVFSFNSVVGASKVGQSVIARLKVLGGQVNAELQPEADGIQTEQKTLETQRTTMDAATYQARAANLQLRIANFEKREQQRQQEMQATQQKQIDVIARQLDPVIRDLYQQRHCSILVDGEAGGVRIVNPLMDLSSAAVAALDLRIQSLTFDREHLDTQPGAAPAAGR